MCPRRQKSGAKGARFGGSMSTTPGAEIRAAVRTTGEVADGAEELSRSVATTREPASALSLTYGTAPPGARCEGTYAEAPPYCPPRTGHT